MTNAEVIMPSFQSLCSVVGPGCVVTSAALLFYPALIYAWFGLDGAPSADVMSRRGGILFLAVGVILWRLRNLTDESAKAGLAFGMFVFMAGFVVLGLVEFARGAVGPGIFLAVFLEAVLAVVFLKFARGGAG